MHGRNVYAACAALYGVRVRMCVPICHKGGGREKERKQLASDFWRSLRERPENSKAGERRLDVKRGKLPSRDILLEGKSRDFLLLYCYSSRLSIGQVVPNFTYTPFASLAC